MLVGCSVQYDKWLTRLQKEAGAGDLCTVAHQRNPFVVIAHRKWLRWIFWFLML